MASAQVEERQLLKAMTWWDGFVVALANPGFLIAALGGSIGALGTAGAFVLWTISIILGSLQNNIHAELAAMFPSKSGGIALYAHEAWRKYLTGDRPAVDVRLLDRLVGRAVDQRVRGRRADPVAVVLGKRLDEHERGVRLSRCRSAHRHRSDHPRVG